MRFSKIILQSTIILSLGFILADSVPAREDSIEDVYTKTREILDQPGDNLEEVIVYLESIEETYSENIDYWAFRASMQNLLFGNSGIEYPLKNIDRLVSGNITGPTTCAQLKNAAKRFFVGGHIEIASNLLLKADKICPLPYQQEQLLCSCLALIFESDLLSERIVIRKERQLPTTEVLKQIFSLVDSISEEYITTGIREATGSEDLHSAFSQLYDLNTESDDIVKCIVKIEMFDLFNDFSQKHIISILHDYVSGSESELNELIEDYCHNSRKWYDRYTSQASTKDIGQWSEIEVQNELDIQRIYRETEETDRIINALKLN